MRTGSRVWRVAGATALLGCLLTSPARAESVAERLKATEEALEESSAQVKAAGLALARTAVSLPAAQREVNLARGELAGTQALLAAAQRKVAAGEALVASATKRVDEASARLEATRVQLGRLARRSYQLGPLQEVRTITESGPADFLERASLLEQAFRGGDAALSRLTVDRFALAEERATLAAVQREVAAARDAAAKNEAKAAAVADRAQRAADRVAALVQERTRALRSARQARAQDLADYRKAEAASRELARTLREAAARAARNATRSVASVGQMLWPTDGVLTSRYGYRTHPIYGDRRLHAGIDIGAGNGTPIIAADGGTVVFAGSAGGYGNLVLISHGTKGGKDLATAYAHQSVLLVSDGQAVSRGQLIGRVGSTGNSTGNHLHFEVRLDGDPVDPLDYVSPP